MIRTDIAISSGYVRYRGEISLESFCRRHLESGLMEGHRDIYQRFSGSYTVRHTLGSVISARGLEGRWMEVYVWLPPGYEGHTLKHIWSRTRLAYWEVWEAREQGALERA